MKRIVPEQQKEVAEFRKQYADKVIGEYNVDQVCIHSLQNKLAILCVSFFVTNLAWFIVT